jgi:UDP-glucose 4-epimerase
VKILVLGANGFIGSNALSYFRGKYPETYGCDIVPPNYNDDKFFVLDRLQPQFDKLFLQNSFDVCINASGSGSVPYSIDHPDEDYRLNAKNVFDILNSISNFNSRCRFLNISSAAVYGNPEVLPIKEKSRTKPLSPYGFHKLISEQICAEYYHLKKIKTCSLRVFSAYGQGLRKQLFWDIYQKSKREGAVELFGTGEETRDFIHINDLTLAIECIINNSNFETDIVNVGSGKGILIKIATSEFLRIMNIDKEICFTARVKEGDPICMEADISKLRSYGFSPAVGLEDGLTQYSKWVQSQ